MFAEVFARANWRRTSLLAALVCAILCAGGAAAQSDTSGGAQGLGSPVSESKGDAPQAPEVTPTPGGDAFIFLTPGTAGSCPAPPNGGTTQVGCSFVLNLMVNAGSRTDTTAQQSYLTFTYDLIKNTRVSDIASCTLTNTFTADLTTFDATFQNEVCNGPGTCTFRGVQVDPGSMAFASGALSNPETGGIFRVAQVGLCTVAAGTAVLHWQFSPPAPSIRDCQIVAFNGDPIHNPALFTDYSFTVCCSPTPTLTSTPTNTPTPIPTCGPGSDYVISQSTGATLVSGTTLIEGTQCDECVTNISLPFVYNFYGIPYSGLNLGVNGNIQFTTNSPAFGSVCLPYPPFNYSILPYWEDLDTSPGVTSSLGVTGIYSSVTGIAPNRILNLEWRACPYNGGLSCGSGAQFEVRLYEGQDRFDVIYGRVGDGGESATIGVQRGTGSGAYGSFTQFSCSAGGIVEGLQLNFAPAPCPPSSPTLTRTPTFTPTPTLTRTPTFTPTPTPTPLLIGHVTWQGRPAQPNALQQVPVTLTLKLGTTEVNYPAQSTDASGFFTVPVTGLGGGTYSWRIKAPKYLANVGTVALTGARRTNVEMGLMRAGDCTNDNSITVADFTVIKNSFGRGIGDPGYNDLGDLTGDGRVNVSDVNWVKANFSFVGPPPIGVER